MINYVLIYVKQCITHFHNYYHLPRKLLEGDVFSRVWLSVCSWGSHVTITLTVQAVLTPLPHPRHETLIDRNLPDPGLTPPWTRTSLNKDPLLVTSSDHHWRLVQTSSLQDIDHGIHQKLVRSFLLVGQVKQCRHRNGLV